MINRKLKTKLEQAFTQGMQQNSLQCHILAGVANCNLLEHCLETIKDISTRHTIIHLTRPKIKELRELHTVISQKNASSSKWIVIEDITQTSIAAQNSLLKSMEQPTENLFFVLLAYNPKDLLGTIVSRSNYINCFEILNGDSSPLLGNTFKLTEPGIEDGLAKINQQNWREVVVREFWDQKNMEREDLIYIIDFILNNLNLRVGEFIACQKLLKNLLHTGSVKLNLYNLPLIGKTAFNLGT